MKIEILEQMFASYLKNCEGCLLTSTNWTPSEVLLGSVDPADKAVMEAMVNEIKSTSPLNIFKNSTFDQFLGQCEIDVVGIKEETTARTAYLFDTAFHEAGLNYKDSAANVMKKLIRAFMIGKLFFKGYKIDVGFISPKCMPKLEASINAELSNIIAILSHYDPSIHVSVYLNSTFEPIIENLVALKDDIADDNDLFIRAVKLLYLGEKKQAVSKAKAVQNIKANQTNKDIVLSAFEDLLAKGKVVSLLPDLLDKDYTKATFGISTFPFLKKADSISAKEHVRYYPRLFLIDGEAYRVCSQWIPERMTRFDAWYKAHC